jgi:7,8-dihydroneopterin aldolase/epimerase/oxygenase
VSADVKAAATTDDIVSTLSDRDVRHALETFVGNSSFQLIETLAEQTAALVMTTFGVNWLRLELIKPSRYVGSTVGIVIERRPATARGAGAR